jgi:hypothetical protein
VKGTYAVVINLDNVIDAPEYVVQSGTFSGDMDLSMRPLGTVVGTVTPAGTSLQIPFTGRFRLPFKVDALGKKHNAKRGDTAYYLADDAKTKMPLQTWELSLASPLVRLELKF